ncbi:TPA: type II toxin-antitoxin system RelE/ParE family toxin [Candidatus Micrarchaeota archaeon]|nr:type II toxin-antitoxin system RelE/ParE family toxin [Candidatus Micrarchaeota archaeon]
MHHSDEFESEFVSLDNSVKERINKAVKKILEKPELGKPLKSELAGCFSEHVGGYRIIYKYDDEFVYLLRCRKRKEGY